MKIQTDPPALYTLRDVASIVKLAPGTIRRLVREERFPRPVRVGGSLRWRHQDIERLLDAGVVQ